jgi:hypothetical protein
VASDAAIERLMLAFDCEEVFAWGSATLNATAGDITSR